MTEPVFEQLAEVAEQFLTSAGLPISDKPFAVKINEALTDDEAKVCFDSMMTMLDSDQNHDHINEKAAIKIAETFAKVANRIGVQPEAASHIIAPKTHKATADQFDQADAPELAALVRLSRTGAQLHRLKMIPYIT